MASLCTRILYRNLRTTSIVPCRTFWGRKKIDLPDPLDLATGLEKREMLAKMAGNTDPYDLKIMKRGISSRDKPNIVNSNHDSRIIGCICEEDASYINWMWLHKGDPKRCRCGHWFKLEYKDAI